MCKRRPVVGNGVDIRTSLQPELSLLWVHQTADIVLIVVIYLLHSSVPEGELAHPVYPAAYARRHAEAGVSGGCSETIGGEVIVAENKETNVSFLDEHYEKHTIKLF